MNVSAARLVEEFGFTERHWIRMAAAGRVPGARQPFGPRSSWVFDLTAVRRWWESTLKTAPEQPMPAVVGKRRRVASRRPAMVFDSPSTADLRALVANVLASGTPRSKRKRRAPT